MTRLLPFLFLAGLATEIASIIAVGGLVGVIPTLLLLFAGGVLGISRIKSAGTGIIGALRSPLQTAAIQRDVAGKAIWRVVSGLLFLLPGFFSDSLGILLLFPWITRWLAARIPIVTFSSGDQRSEHRDIIIDAEAIEIVDEIEAQRQAKDWPDR